MTEMNGRYLYGVVELNAAETFTPLLNKEGEKVYCITRHNVGCVVKDAVREDLLTKNKEAVAGHLVEHQHTIEKIMEEHAVIPIKFGAFLDDDEEVMVMLSRGEKLFSDLMHGIEGRIELDVVAAWHDLNSIIRNIGEQDQEIVDFKREVSENPPEDMFQASLQVGAMVKTALDARREALQERIIEPLKGLSLRFQIHDLMEDKMILNCAFLLDEDAEDGFDVVLHKLDEEFEKQVDFRCVGPLPPYSFATCEVIKPDFRETENARRLLDLKERADPGEIKAAYRDLIKNEHPDQAKTPEAQQRFKAVKSAHEYLMNMADDREISFRQEDLKQSIIVRPFDVAGTRTYNR